jgi:hypothetical protein
MHTEAKIVDNVSKYSGKIEGFKDYRDLIGNEAFTKLEELIVDFKINAERALDENRLMRIGIIGQIKRGKSSFLNALFFNGEDVLPKAATPMTAALTKINYSKNPKAIIEFYSQNEWNNIKLKADEAKTIEQKNTEIRNRQKKNKGKLFQKGENVELLSEISTDQKSCLELVKMVSKSDLDVSEFLGKNKEIQGAGSTSSLVNELGNYVGSHGKFTPIVKSTILSLDIESLKNIEIVDTPGMNDPIVSRARRTEEFMGQCDVVFLLSYCSQFLDVTDMKLLAQNIPSKGIRNIVLVGSLFDSVLLDEFEKYDSIGEAIGSLTEKKKNEARSNFLNVKQQIKKKSLNEALDSAFPPVFISSMCFNISKHFTSMNSEEKKVLDNLNSMYDDFEFNADTLNSLANFEEIIRKFDDVKNDKNKILAKRTNHIFEGFIEGFSHQTELIKKNLIHKKNNLIDGDIEKLIQKQANISKTLATGTVKLNSVFERHLIEAEKNFADILIEIDDSSNMAKRLTNQSGSETRSYEVSNSKWYNPFSWFSTRTEYQTITYTYANVNEAVENIEEYIISSKKVLINAVKAIINIHKFKIDITDSIQGMFDFGDDDFDPDDILIPVENAVNRITIPSIEVNVDKHIDTIRDQFQSPEVRNDEINSLRREQARVVTLITKDLKVEVEESLEKITSKLNSIKNDFIPSLTKDLKTVIEDLAEQIKNREVYIKRYDEIITKL